MTLGIRLNYARYDNIVNANIKLIAFKRWFSSNLDINAVSYHFSIKHDALRAVED